MIEQKMEVLQDLPTANLPTANLPNLIRKGVEVFGNVEQQELMTYSIITTVSALLHNVSGTYDKEDRYPNLFLMVLGYAGTGKGVLCHSRQLLAGINNRFTKKSLEEQEIFHSIKKDNRGIAPPFKTVLIPGSVSQARLMKHLSDNDPDVPSIIFETEMDTLSNAMKAEHGKFSPLIRNGFQNEPISKSKVENSEFISIECPKPALVLSGTPGQFASFINNREDGLLSRFLVVDFKGSDGWRNVGPSPESINLTEYFKKLSPEYLKFYEFISENSLKVSLTENQWKSIETYGTEKLKDVLNTFGREANGIVFRNGLILFKICMVLTALRKFDDGNTSNEILCTDIDFETALYLTDRSMFSVLNLWESLPKTKQFKGSKKSEYLSSLPYEFSRDSALEVADKLSISKRSADRHLKDYVDNNELSQKTKGFYFKPEWLN